MACILGVGVATLDIVNEVDGYPAEDSEVRAVAQQRRRGGNATNTLVVLSQLQHACTWAGTLANDADAVFIIEDLRRHAVDVGPARIVEQGKSPTSYIVLNRRNGSRSIVHYRDLPEFGYADFCALDLHPYDWLHFEGRHITDTAQMLARARQAGSGATLSLEVEKARDRIETLFSRADVLLLSRAYARGRGFGDPGLLLDWVATQAPQARVFLAWGEYGGFTRSQAGRLIHQAAIPVERVIDTVGAGDVFNAGIIDALLRGASGAEALGEAVALAGQKCAQHGLDGLTHRTAEPN